MNHDLILEFCSSDEDREKIALPFHCGQGTYATDGRILISIPRDNTIKETVEAPGSLAEVWKAFARSGPGEPVGDVPTPEVWCERCYGTGFFNELKTKRCNMCDGVGRHDSDMSCSSMRGHRLFDNRYLRLLQKLPNCRIYPALGSSMHPMSFTFDDGGEGLLMPMKKAPTTKL